MTFTYEFVPKQEDVRKHKPTKRIKKARRPIRRVRKTPLSVLRRKAEKTFKNYIRRRDCANSVGKDWCKCYTCLKDCVLDQSLHAGHFLHGAAHYSVYFDERNCHSQCVQCNTFNHGNLGAYAIRLLKDYGSNFVEELTIAGAKVHKYTREEYEQIIVTYTNKLKKL